MKLTNTERRLLLEIISYCNIQRKITCNECKDIDTCIALTEKIREVP